MTAALAVAAIYGISSDGRRCEWRKTSLSAACKSDLARGVIEGHPRVERAASHASSTVVRNEDLRAKAAFDRSYRVCGGEFVIAVCAARRFVFCYREPVARLST
jgi:hypothetical protein